MFMGEYSHSLDPKGRMTIPAKFRERLGERFVVTRSLDTCLAVYDMEAWEAFSKKLSELPYNAQEQREFVRFFFSGAAEVEPDKMGRILLPPPLRVAARIEKDVVLIGAGSRIEIWSKELWRENQSSEVVNQIAEKMLANGFMI